MIKLCLDNFKGRMLQAFNNSKQVQSFHAAQWPSIGLIFIVKAKRKISSFRRSEKNVIYGPITDFLDNLYPQLIFHISHVLFNCHVYENNRHGSWLKPFVVAFFSLNGIDEPRIYFGIARYDFVTKRLFIVFICINLNSPKLF